MPDVFHAVHCRPVNLGEAQIGDQRLGHSYNNFRYVRGVPIDESSSMDDLKVKVAFPSTYLSIIHLLPAKNGLSI